MYVMFMMFFSVGFFLVVFNIYMSYKNLVHRGAAKIAESVTQRDVAGVESELREGVQFLEATSLRIDEMLEKGATTDEVDTLLLEETERHVTKSSPNFRGLFAYINDHLVDPLNWQSDVSYDPTKRPWYKEAFKQRGNIAIVPTYTDAKYGVPVVSVCKRLADKKSVLVFNILLDKIKNRIAEVGFENDQWFVLSKNGLVVSHSNVSDQGVGYLSSLYWGSEKEALARKIIQIEQGSFDFVLDDRKYSVFVEPILEYWYMVRLVDRSLISGRDRGFFLQNVLVVVMLFVFSFVVVTFLYRRCVKAERGDRTKLFFIGNFCNELRGPISGIIGLSSIIQKNSREKYIADYGANIRNSGNSLLSVINDVKDLARLEGGVLKLNEIEYDLFSVLKDCYDSVSPKAFAKNLRLSIDCNPAIPSGIWGDRVRLRQTLNNVMQNAVDHTEIGGVQVMVDYTPLPNVHGLTTGERIMLNITVKDSGLGMTRSDAEEFGLGVNLTKMLVSAYGGDCSIRSQYGEGTSLSISIPQLVLNVEPMGDFASKYQEAQGTDGDVAEKIFIPGVRILVVDDMEMNLKVFCGLLKDSKAQIDTALNGAQALELAKSRRYNIIFLDQMMPAMDGFETLARMKSMTDSPNQKTPVIMFTAGSGEESATSFLKAGFADYIPKPFKERDLVRLLKWHLPKEQVLTQDDLADVAVENQVPAKEEALEIELKTVTVAPAERIALFRQCLNVDVGLEYCANDEAFYVEMLGEYVNDEKSQSIQSTFDREDWKNYQILVHALKGMSLTIGAEGVFEMAKNIDLACKEQKFEYVKEHHAEMINAYGLLISDIKKGLSVL